MKELRIVFLGTPEFAATCLEKLVLDGFKIVAVVTAVDRKKGRGQKLQASEVKITAEKYSLPVLQPSNLKDESFKAELDSFKPDLGVVVAFRMLPVSIWSLPKLGTLNLHASLLPNYRGAAPINWAVINGEAKTGITTFFLKHEIDTGDVIMRRAVNIGPDMNAGELHDLLMHEGAELLSETVKTVSTGKWDVIPQEKLVKELPALKSAPKIFKEDCKINWEKKATDIHNFIRGLSPYPSAWGIFLTLEGEELIFKVFKSAMTDNPSNGKAGLINTDGKSFLQIACSDYYLDIHDIQLQGRQKMEVSDFLRGFNIKSVTIKL